MKSVLKFFCARLLLILLVENISGRRGNRQLLPFEYVPNEPADPQMYAYVVKLGIKFPEREELEICTGTLITRSVVLTAGHCVATDSDSGKVQYVEFPYGVSPAKVQVSNVAGIYREFPPFHDLTLDEQIDTALIVLKESISICDRGTKNYIPILKLPVKDVSSADWSPARIGPQTYDNCTIVGYGKTVPGYHNLRKISRTGLWHRNNRFLVPLLAADKQGRTCYGDSGGPTICNDASGRPRLYGLTSFASGQLESLKRRCYEEDTTYLVDILTDVQYVLPMLRRTLQEIGKVQEIIDDYRRCQ